MSRNTSISDISGPPRGPLDYDLCRYGSSRLAFRGPYREAASPYVACLGGTEFFGKYLHAPIPSLLEDRLQMPCLNFGCVNAGVDAFTKEPGVVQIASDADVAVVQLLGAQNASNRFYNVHPRRNDRFVEATDLLRAVFPEVDFTAIHFTRHALQELRRVSSSRFYVVVDELKAVWVDQMSVLLRAIAAPVVLFWMGDHLPAWKDVPDGGRDPLFIDRDMINALRPFVFDVVECAIPAPADANLPPDMVVPQGEEDMARLMFDGAAHRVAAELLEPVIRRALGQGAEAGRKTA